MNVFKFTIAGTVTKNGVRTNTLPSGDTVANLTLVSFKKQKDKEDQALFYPITFFGKAADVIV